MHGASGGVGLACVQIAKSLGLKVVGTAGTTEGLSLVQQHGADATFNHRDTDYTDSIMVSFNNAEISVSVQCLT